MQRTVPQYFAVVLLTTCFFVALGHAQQRQPVRLPSEARRQAADQLRTGQLGQLNQGAQRQVAPAGPPKRFQISARDSERINRMLAQWEKTSGNIKTFRTDFVRWNYDPHFGPKNAAKTISGGEIRYASPDRGEIRETRLAEYSNEKAKRGEKWPYTEEKETVGEHWVCDGASIFEFNHRSKELIETTLPKELRGKAIAEAPLPFMFGAKASTIRNRFWIREIRREKESDPWQLELMPKGRGEDFSLLRVRLDTKEFLPVLMEIHGLNGVGRSVYQFNNRRVNAVSDNVRNFWDSFVSPKTPRGWTKMVHKPVQPADQQALRPSPQQR